MKQFIAKLSQGSSNPHVVIVSNSLDGEPDITRIEEGRFRITLLNAFLDENKITGLRELHFANGGYFRLDWDDETETPGDSLILQTFSAQNVLTDNLLSATEVRFEVWD